MIPITIDVLSHELVPRFRILKKEEKEKLLETFQTTEENLPKILDTDPVVKVLKASIGDVLEIIRNSPTAGESKYYRIVVGKKKILQEEAAIIETDEEAVEEDEAPLDSSEYSEEEDE